MIEVFETWFSQFNKVEQMRLLDHIKKNHINVKGEEKGGSIDLQNSKGILKQTRVNNAKKVAVF